MKAAVVVEQEKNNLGIDEKKHLLAPSSTLNHTISQSVTYYKTATAVNNVHALNIIWSFLNFDNFSNDNAKLMVKVIYL